MRQVLRIAVVAFLLWSLVAPSVLAADDVRVAVRGPESWGETDSYRLEVGNEMWIVVPSRGGFVTTVASSDLVAVFRRQRDCQEILRIALKEGGRFVIRAAGDGTFSVEDRTETGLDLGPSLESQPFAPCLPDTATGPTASPDVDAPWVPVVLLTLSGLATLSWRHRRGGSVADR